MKLYTILSAIALCSLIKGFNQTQLKEPTGIFIIKSKDVYITYKTWKLLYHVDLQNLYQDIEELQNCVARIESLCSNTIEKDQCEYLLARIQKHVMIIATTLLTIENLHQTAEDNKKIKRSILTFSTEWDTLKDWHPLGFVHHWFYKPIFGILGEDDAFEFTNKINSLINKTIEHNIFLQDELSIIKQTILKT